MSIYSWETIVLFPSTNCIWTWPLYAWKIEDWSAIVTMIVDNSYTSRMFSVIVHFSFRHWTSISYLQLYLRLYTKSLKTFSLSTIKELNARRTVAMFTSFQLSDWLSTSFYVFNWKINVCTDSCSNDELFCSECYIVYRDSVVNP